MLKFMLKPAQIFQLYFIIYFIECNSKENLQFQSYPYELPVVIYESHQAFIRACIGTPRQCFNFKIASNIDRTFITQKTIERDGYNPINSLTFNQLDTSKNFKFGLSTITGFSISETLQIPGTDIDIPNFKLVLIYRLNKSQYDGVIGLGSVYSENDYSLIQILFNSNYIAKKMFMVNYSLYEPTGKIEFGDNSSVITKQYRSCSLSNIKMTKQYECLMNSVIYYSENSLQETSIYQEAQYVVFSPGSAFFVAPENFFEFLKNEILKVQMEKSDCIVEVGLNSYHTIICSKKIANLHFGELIFVFGKWNIKIPIKKLFRFEEETRMHLSIKYHEDIRNWMFGYDIFQYNQVLFDLEEQSVYIKPKV